jgi:hypothetical protein
MVLNVRAVQGHIELLFAPLVRVAVLGAAYCCDMRLLLLRTQGRDLRLQLRNLIHERLNNRLYICALLSGSGSHCPRRGLPHWMRKGSSPNGRDRPSFSGRAR